MTVLTWSDDRVEQLKKLWESGLSASQIAAELGNVTRNAVIGKVHRLGLSGRAKSPPRRRRASARRVRPSR
jgi:GcrA cell cycle regulator